MYVYEHDIMWSTSGENFAIKHHTNKTGFPPGPQPSGCLIHIHTLYTEKYL